MKSRTSSFNSTVFRKDITRFAPAWAAYLILLVLVLVNIADSGNVYYRAMNVQDAIVAMAWVNLIYAAVVAQLIFGDLYNSRLCNALHALPITRDGWFVTHTAAGLSFSLVPNLAVALIGLPALRLGAGWSIVFWWLLAAELQYILFFGTAVLCIMLSGNRLGQLATYAMICFAGMAAAWLATSIYEPLLYGIQFDEEAFYPYCPVAYMTQMTDLLFLDRVRIDDEFGNFMHYELLGVAPGEGWGYLAICVALGMLALAGALALYRKRKLECAGDFVAFKKMEPVVQVLVTVFAGGFFHLFGDAFGIGSKYVLIFCGMVVGFFACRMLLMRTNRVFQKKAFLGCGAILAVFAMTLAVTWMDPAGITRWVPELDEVESVSFSRAYSLYRHEDYPFTATEAEDLKALLSVHRDCVDRKNDTADIHEDAVWAENGAYYSDMNLRLEYKLKNGRVINRFYGINPQSEVGQILKGYYTRPECVLGFGEEQAHMMTDYIRSIYVDGMTEQLYDLDHLDVDGFIDAILADCAAGNMAQVSGYHYPNNYDLMDEEYDLGVCYVEIGWDHEKWQTTRQSYSEDSGIISYSNFRLYRSCTNTLRWLEDNGRLSDEAMKEMVVKYGGAYAEFAIPMGN